MKTDNELIAEFMGVEYDPEYHDGDKYIGEAVAKDGDNDWYAPRYDTSWDWLMPVVEKIGRLHNSKFTYNPIEIAKGNFPDDDQYMNVITLPLFTPIEEVYKVVVEFIKWYNANK